MRKQKRIAIRLTDGEYIALNLTIINKRFRNITDAVRFALNKTIFKPSKNKAGAKP